MAQTHLSYSQFASIYGDLGVTEWTKYNWLADYWKELTPDGFERVQWLQSDGNQYIDLGVKLNQDSIVELKYQYLPNTTFCRCCGNGEVGSSTVGMILSTQTGATDSKIQILYNNVWWPLSDNPGGIIPGTDVHTWRQEGNKAFIDGNPYVTFEPATFTTANNATIFGAATKDNFRYSEMKCYYIYLNSMSIEKYLIPMVRISDNKPGLYDLINHQFYTNQGLLDFLAGPPVGYTQVEYLRSDGLQWIDTGHSLFGHDNTITLTGLIGTYPSWVMNNYLIGDETVNGARACNVWVASDPKLRYSYANATSFYIGTESITGNKFTSVIKQTNDTVEAWLNGNKVVLGQTIDPAELSQYNEIIFYTRTGLQTSETPKRIYEYKLEQDGELVQHLIPTLDSTNRPCMYDLITRQPFYNQGTGEFAWG